MNNQFIPLLTGSAKGHKTFTVENSFPTRPSFDRNSLNTTVTEIPENKRNVNLLVNYSDLQLDLHHSEKHVIIKIYVVDILTSLFYNVF